MVTRGLLFSQIGYDCRDPKRALIRSTEPDFPGEGATFSLKKPGSTLVCHRGKVTYWGKKWNSFWWELDFSPLDEPGEYELIVKKGRKNLYEGKTLTIGDSLLWKETIDSVALDQFEKRADLAPHGKIGWKDCGANMKEANSHATTIIGMCDLLGLGFENYLTEDQQNRLVRQIINGCDYLDRAVSAYDYLLNRARPYGPSGFSHKNHGAPEDFKVPDDFMTRDLMMMMWGGYELCLSGQLKYKEKVVELAKAIGKRQIPKKDREGGFYGHFRTFDQSPFTEKANVHHHIGHDTGGTFPYYIVPLVEMARNWFDHKDNPLWRKMIEDFTYGFFIPACRENPFNLIPEGYFTGQGILNFCGPWHGINTTIAFGASLAAPFSSPTKTGFPTPPAG